MTKLIDSTQMGGIEVRFINLSYAVAVDPICFLRLCMSIRSVGKRHPAFILFKLSYQITSVFKLSFQITSVNNQSYQITSVNNRNGISSHKCEVARRWELLVGYTQ